MVFTSSVVGFLVSGFWFLVSGSWFLVPGFWLKGFLQNQELETKN